MEDNREQGTMRLTA